MRKLSGPYLSLIFLISCSSLSNDSRYQLSLEKIQKTVHYVEQDKLIDALKTLEERSHFTCDSPCLTYRDKHAFYEFKNRDESFIVTYISAINQCATRSLKNLNEVEACLRIHLRRERNSKMDDEEFQKELHSKAGKSSRELKHRYFCQPFWGDGTPRQSTTATYFLLKDSDWEKFKELTKICSVEE